MMCSNCGKREANFMYTEIINGVKKEVRLCSDCAEKLGYFENMSFNMPSLDFPSFFGDFLNEYNTLMPSIFSGREKAITCSRCGMEYDDFLKSGLLGCSNCYDVFQDEIDPLMRKLHGGARFLGKKSSNKRKFNLDDLKTVEKVSDNKLENLKEELKQAIRVEKAAEIRDEIKKLEQGNEKNKEDKNKQEGEE